jgi:hypothetical protein
MTLTRLIGDIHGMFYDYQAHSIADFAGPTIQIGDFGIGFGQGDYWHESVNDFHTDGTHRFIRGNHDNPRVCKQDMVGYIADGTVENDVMYIGGAWSIDNPAAPLGWYRRTPELDWWFDEECSDEEFERMYEEYKRTKPRVMITHDCPARISYPMFWGSGFLRGPVYPNRTSEWFDRFLDAHQPDEWYFGHWHKTMTYQEDKTRFQCIGELDYVDVEL